MRRSLMLGSLFIVAFPGLAFAQAAGAATGGWVGPFTVIAAGIGMAIAAGLCGLGQGRAVARPSRPWGVSRVRRPASRPR